MSISQVDRTTTEPASSENGPDYTPQVGDVVAIESVNWTGKVKAIITEQFGELRYVRSGEHHGKLNHRNVKSFKKIGTYSERFSCYSDASKKVDEILRRFTTPAFTGDFDW